LPGHAAPRELLDERRREADVHVEAFGVPPRELTVAGVEEVAADENRVGGFAVLAPGDDGSSDRLVGDEVEGLVAEGLADAPPGVVADEECAKDGLLGFEVVSGTLHRASPRRAAAWSTARRKISSTLIHAE
jgi:hypothetical protein